MTLDDEICDNVYNELERMNEDLNTIRYIVLTPNNSDNNSVSSDEDLTYPHVVQPSNITCLSSTSQNEINIIESPSPMKSTSFTFNNETELYELSSSLAK